MRKFLWMALVAAGLAATSKAEEPFAKVIGEIEAKPYTQADPVEVPYIFWGGDVVTWYANGGQTTTPDSIYGKMGLKVKLVPGDDFQGQVRNLLGGKTPFLRAELRMLVLASEVVNKSPATRQDVVLQLTWSAGDHLVGREKIKTANDLKGKKIVLQQYGPHVGMLDDILRSAGLTWKDVTVVWAKDLSGTDNSPSAMFSKDESIDAAFVISPDMIGLTGGIDQTGSGAEGTVAGAHVVISTAQMSRSLADVYSVSDQFRKKNPEFVSKFIAGYLKATNEVVALRKAYKANPRSAEGQKYTKGVLQLAQNIWGKKALPTLEVDAAGLLDDATFVGLEGNIAFFNQEGNQAGYAPKLKLAVALAKGQGYISTDTSFAGSGLDYESVAKLAGIEYKAPVADRQRFAEGAPLGADESLDGKTLVSRTITFEPNKTEFDASIYTADFDLVLQNLSLYGNAKLVIRGHSDPSQTLRELVMAGKEKGLIREQNVKGKRTYFLQDGSVLDLSKTRQIVKMIEEGAFDGTSLGNGALTGLLAQIGGAEPKIPFVREGLAAPATSR